MNILAIFMKHPEPGKVKTRLGREIGFDEAAELYQAFQLDLLESTQRTSDQRVIAFSPVAEASRKYFVEHANEDDLLWEQPEATLGERLIQVFDDFLNQDNRVVVIGSDSPSLPNRLIEEAFRQLETSDIVLGPACDGGYYLVGQRTRCPEMFNDISWSEPSVLSQTVERIRNAQQSLCLLEPWYDVDSLDDLQMLREHLDAMRTSNSTENFPMRTFELTHKLLAEL
ncbi:2-phospho-L-lactate guanylyltransferase [Thalassoglobus neptunius]|uniref:2-phospho-L-lactate guanylyltransferase n=1 Tax=Thalassoglobus neptunius TaxID=1938619 RepID=A0A5C5WNR5_9PLAN|nr:TIGR04282 family arsenosugar biosynthesis glycosyltransferase [Thalassoglobus neptunius]TWT52278.1 2-phospho-L-lactate guanylyltransferase [Thalassoglobus neptunius]